MGVAAPIGAGGRVRICRPCLGYYYYY